MKSIINRVIALLVLFTMVAAPVSANDTFQADQQDLKQERSSFVSEEPPVSTDIPELVKFEAHRDADRATIRNLLAPAFTAGNAKESGLIKATLDKDVLLNPDPTRSNPIDNLSQVFVKRIDVPANSIRMVAEITKTTATYLDMYLYHDADRNGIFGGSDFISEVARSVDYIDLAYINGSKDWVFSTTTETYFLVAQNYRGVAGDTFTLATGVVPLAPEVDNNYDVTIPSTRLADEPFQIDVFWNEDIEEGDRLYGYFETCADVECAVGVGLVGKTDLDIQRLVDDVVKTANVIFAEAGDTITYTIVITRRADVAANYSISDALPEGVTFVPGTLTEGAAYDPVNRVITWTGPVSSPGAPYYRVTDSNNDPSCDTGVFGGGYVNLADYGIFPSLDIFGDGKAWTLPDVEVPFNYYGEVYPTIALTDDGFAVFDVPANYLGSSANINQDIPDPIKPNAVIAPLWQDMEIEYSAALNQGLSIWSNEEGTVHIFEYDDIHLDNELSMTYDFEIVYNHVPDFTPGHPEIIFAYDNIKGPLSAATIGVENFDGSDAELYAFNNADFDNGHMICFNLFVPSNTQVITFQVTVDEDAAVGPLVNVVLHDNDTAGTLEESAGTVVLIDNAPVLNGIGNKPVDELVQLTFTAMATDADLPAPTLIFSLVGAPAGAEIDATTGTFTWTPTEAQGPSSYTFDVCVSDSLLSDCESITVTVNEVNVAPILTAIGDKTVVVGETLTFTAMATDADLPAPTLIFSLVGAPVGASISTSGAFSWNTTGFEPGDYAFQVCVSDGELSDCETIKVSVSAVPDPLPIKLYLPLIFR